MNEYLSRASGVAEGTWQKAEQNQFRRERARLIKNKTITFASVPNILVFVEGETETGASWKFPSLKAA